MQTLINILIRTSNRPRLFERCLQSIYDQDYPNIRIIVSVDNDLVDYIPEGIEVIKVEKNNAHFGYDLYINDLKAMVNDGYFFILDDDDILAPDVLNKLQFDAPALLVQINHLGSIIPKSIHFGHGQCGFPCLILHHTLKNIADIVIPLEENKACNDYNWIQAVKDKVELKFVPLVLVICDQKGNGI
jgi:glycosyltransferase involved in cell wall biosynthesis